MVVATHFDLAVCILPQRIGGFPYRVWQRKREGANCPALEKAGFEMSFFAGGITLPINSGPFIFLVHK